MESHRILSPRLDEAMDMVGASESMRRLHRRAATKQEILLDINMNNSGQFHVINYFCGSSYEGTFTPDTASDVDMIHCLTIPSVVTHRLMAGSGLRYLVFRDDCTYPGYVKLQLLMDGQLGPGCDAGNLACRPDPSGWFEMESHRILSARLDEAMDMVGASESMRRLHRRAATTQEILLDIYMNTSGQFHVINYFCGSSYEGTFTSDTASDVDMIHCHTRPSVVTHRLMAGSGLRYLVFRDDWTYPGYVKLQLLWNGQPLTDGNLRADDDWGFDRRGRACLKPLPGDNMHGPAQMNIADDGTHIADYVPARKCNGIPPFAAEWIRRRRSHGWPSEQQLDQMRAMACMVVKVGFYNSPERDIEWRLSFSLQERLLMTSLNTYQHKVYIILKLIKKHIFVNELHEESLSSYHCKTCIFYMAELTPPRMWTRDTLILCLLECIRLLLKWLRNRFCPSYFIKQQNLFEKEGFERFIEPLQRSVELILQSGHQFLYMLESDNIGEILRSGDFRLCRQVSYGRVNRYILVIRLRVEYIAVSYRKALSVSSRNQDVLSFLMAKLETIQSKDRVSGHTPEETKVAIRHMLPWLHFQIGLEFACRAATCSTRSNGKELMKKVDFRFFQARNTDFANVQLAQASILFRFGKFEECFLLLQEIEARWSFRVISYCTCEGQQRTHVPSEQILQDYYPPMRDMSDTKLLRTYFATCVVFLPSQSELVPPPLKYEMSRSLGTPPGTRAERKDDWFDWVVVDAKVYIHFMQYLVCSRLEREPHKQIAKDLIHHAHANNLGHRETAYNLLGWIYMQENQTLDAVRCFIKSWQIRPHHNAAKFHMLNEYRKLAEEQSQNQA